MSPFASQLKTLRISRGLRQVELAELVGYDQSYVSSLELGLKGPPTKDFVVHLIDALTLSTQEQVTLHEAISASQRRYNLPCEASIEIYWLLHKLHQQIDKLHPRQIDLIEIALNLKEDLVHPCGETLLRIKRRYKKTNLMEAEM